MLDMLKILGATKKWFHNETCFWNKVVNSLSKLITLEKKYTTLNVGYLFIKCYIYIYIRILHKDNIWHVCLSFIHDIVLHDSAPRGSQPTQAWLITINYISFIMYVNEHICTSYICIIYSVCVYINIHMYICM